MSGEERPRPAVALAAALALAATAHSPAASAPLVWDDHQLVAGSALPRSLDPTVHLARPFELGPGRYYRPATTWSFALDLAWGGARPGPFHLTNLALHLVAVALVFALARRGGAGSGSAAFAAATFGCLPRLTESVDWISGRTDLLASVLALAALLLHRPGPHAWPRRLAAAGALLLGLLSKEVALAALVALAVGEAVAVRAGATPGRALRNLAPAAGAALLYAGLRVSALGGSPLATGGVHLTPWERLLAAVQALGRYLLMLLDPLRPRLRIGQLGRVEPLALALGVLTVVALTLALRHALRHPPEREPATALALSLAALLPVLHLVPIALSAEAADRFLYLPAAGLAVAAAPAFARMAARWPRGAPLTGAAALLLLAVATYARALDWTDERRLWEMQARVDPDDAFAAHQIGLLELDAGRPEAALPHLRRAAAHAPPHLLPSALSDLAAVLSDLGQQEEARALLRRSLALAPGVDAQRNLILVELRDLRFTEAQAALAVLARVRPAVAVDLSALLSAARRDFGSLPPERAGEPPETRALRARFFERMGLPRLAYPQWLQVAARSEVAADQLEAASRLASLGDLAAAQQALEAARRLGGDTPDTGRLADALREAAARKARGDPAPPASP